VTADHREIEPGTGMQKGYVVLSAEERAKGFVRPVRMTYTHVGKMTEMVNDTNGMVWEQRIGGCGQDTTMGISLAETYARCPSFYGGTYCAFCRTHRPLDEFVWAGTNEQVGS